jgi:hypothetical protein
MRFDLIKHSTMKVPMDAIVADIARSTDEVICAWDQRMEQVIVNHRMMLVLERLVSNRCTCATPIYRRQSHSVRPAFQTGNILAWTAHPVALCRPP